MRIVTNTVVEIAGSPKEFVDKTMGLVLEHIEKKEGSKILDKKRFPVEKVDNLFSTFTELEIEFEEFQKLVDFCFEHMPSHLEIEEPQHFDMRREDFAELFNLLLMRLHKTDEAVKEVNARFKLVEEANRILVKNIIALALKKAPLKLEELSKRIGIKDTNLMSILDSYKDLGLVKETKGKFSFIKK